MPLTTRCERCGRLFQVYAQELKVRRGRVSCPQCGARFDGVAALLDESRAAYESPNGRGGIAARLGFGNGKRGAAAAPAVTPVAARLGIGGGSARARETVSPAPPRPAQHPAPARPRRPRARPAWLFGSLLLLLALAAQWAWWQRDDLLRDPRGRGALETVCSVLGCRLPTPRVPGALAVLDPTLAPDPAGGGQTLKLRLKNLAQVPQPMPLLDLDLLDRDGELAATRRFALEDYAPGARSPLAPGETREVGLAVVAPEAQTSGFRVRLQ